MHKGQQLEEVIRQVVHARDHKRDFVADTRTLSMHGDGSLEFWIGEEQMEVKPTELCLGQITERVGIPKAYANKMQQEAPELLARNVNHWFTKSPEKRMLRTLQNGQTIGRAFLSDQYRALDNADIAAHILPRIADVGCQVMSSAVTDTRLYIQAVTPKITGEIKKVGDVVQSGLVIRNSEVGCGSLAIEQLIYTLRCTNGMIASSVFRKSHVGRRQFGEMGEEAAEYFSDKTRRADDAAFWLKVQDVVKQTLSQEAFDKVLAKLNGAAGVEIDKPTDVVEVLSERFTWSKDEQDSILNHFLKGGMPTQYGMLNAVTRAAEDVASYDRAVELERQGGLILELPKATFTNN